MTKMPYKFNEKNQGCEFFFNALSNDTEITITDMLRNEEKTVSEITDALGFEQSRGHYILRCLTLCGSVMKRKADKKMDYSLSKEDIKPFYNIVDGHFGNYLDLLCEIKVL